MSDDAGTNQSLDYDRRSLIGRWRRVVEEELQVRSRIAGQKRRNRVAPRVETHAVDELMNALWSTRKKIDGALIFLRSSGPNVYVVVEEVLSGRGDLRFRGL